MRGSALAFRSVRPFAKFPSASSQAGGACSSNRWKTARSCDACRPASPRRPSPPACRSATAMEIAPNGDLWVLEQGGVVKRFAPGSTTADVVGNVSGARPELRRRARPARHRLRPELRHQQARLPLLHRHHARPRTTASAGSPSTTPTRPTTSSPARTPRRPTPAAAARRRRRSSSSSTPSSAPPTTTAAPSTSARTASSTSPSATTPTAPTPSRSPTCTARCCASTPTAPSRPTTRSSRTADRRRPGHLGPGPAQPVHVHLPARHRPDVHQRRRPEHLGGDQRRHRRAQLRLAEHRGRLQTSRRFPELHRGRSTPTRTAAARSRASPSPAGRSTTRRTQQVPRRRTPATTSSPTSSTTGSTSSTLARAPSRGSPPAPWARSTCASPPTAACTTWPATPARSSASCFTANQAPNITQAAAEPTVSDRRHGDASPSPPAARAPLAYQWQKLDGGTWTNLANGGRVSGAPRRR